MVFGVLHDLYGLDTGQRETCQLDDRRLCERPYGASYITFITPVLIFIFHIYISGPTVNQQIYE